MQTGITISLETGSSAKKKNTSAHTKGRVGFLRLLFAVGGLVVAVILFSGWNVSLGSLRMASLSHYSFKEVWNVCVNGELTRYSHVPRWLSSFSRLLAMAAFSGLCLAGKGGTHGHLPHTVISSL